jgi:hypothetical protein
MRTVGNFFGRILGSSTYGMERALQSTGHDDAFHAPEKPSRISANARNAATACARQTCWNAIRMLSFEGAYRILLAPAATVKETPSTASRRRATVLSKPAKRPKFSEN